jgi:GNAT superfamily N-acetyltransferase
MPEIRVSEGKTVASAMYVTESRIIAIAEMNLMSTLDFGLEDIGSYVWWICRVKVEPKYRRQGYGRALVDELAKHQRGFAMIVTPGGYDVPKEEQDAFYAACGFVQRGEFMVRSLA